MRLTNPAVPPVVRPVTITFDGQPIEALPGETIAAALSAAGILALRRTDSGAPRGLWCGMGACFDCLVELDGRANVQACMVTVRPGLSAKRQIGVLFATGLLINFPMAGWAVLAGILCRLVWEKLRGADGEGDMEVFAAGVIAGRRRLS